MWIERICIESFGVFRNLSIDDVGPYLTVVLGPNEAGKSTVLEFVRSVLFGYRTRSSRANTYEPPDGLSRKGWMKFRSADGSSLRVHRTERPGLKEGAIEVWDAEGNRLEPTSVATFRGMDRTMYERLLALDLEGMRNLDRDALRGRIVSAALGSFGVNPLDVGAKLDDRIKALGKRSLRDSDCLCAMQVKLKELDAQLNKLAARPARYLQLTEELAAVDRRRGEIGAEIGDRETRMKRLERLLAHEEDWKRLIALQRDLAIYEDARTFPVDGISRLEQILEKETELEESFFEEKGALERTRETLAAKQPDRALLAHSDRILALSRVARDLAHLPREIEETRSVIAQGYRDFDEEAATLGAQWTRGQVQAFDPALSLEHKTRGFQDLWEEHTRKTREMEALIRDSSDAMDNLTEKIAIKRVEWQEILPGCNGLLAPYARNALTVWKECRNRIEDLEEKVAEKHARLKALVAERVSLEERLTELEQDRAGKLSPALVWGMMAFLVLTGFFLLWNVRASTGSAWYTFSALGVLVLVFAVGDLRGKIKSERARSERLGREMTAVQRKREQLFHEGVHIENERRVAIQAVREMRLRSQKIAEDVLGNACAGFEEIVEAEHRAALAEEPVRQLRIVEERINELQTDLQAEQGRNALRLQLLAAAEADFTRIKREWDRLLTGLGLDSDWEPETVLVLFQRLRDLKSRLRRICEHATALEVMETEWSAFHANVMKLARDMGKNPGIVHRECGNASDTRSGGLRNPDRSEVLDLVDHWVRMEREAREILAETRAGEERMLDHQKRLSVLKTQAEAARDSAATLMDAAYAQSEEDFRERALRHATYENLGRNRKEVAERLVSRMQCEDEAAVQAEMGVQDWRENRVLFADHQERLEISRQEAENLASQQGRLTQEIETLEHDEETEQLLTEKEEWHERLNQAVSEWVTLKLAKGLLEKTLKLYETEKRPKVLESASRLFSRISGEKDERVLFPMDADHVVIERNHGTRVQENYLSRGTLEQVYLALRLAHLDVYHRGELGVPLMMDDVLVNFDPERARRAAATLAWFSAEANCQVLFFTCHPHTASLFPDHVPIIDLQSAAGKLPRIALQSSLSL